jgi:HK97 family phage prohead protease
MIHKTMIASAKAVDEAEGIVEAYTNSMGVIDADGDIVEPTAFDSSISGNLPIPVLSGHDQGKLVGKVIFAQPRHIEGDEYRLFTRMQMNMQTEAGRDAFSNVAGDFVREWSVGFNIPKDDDITHEGEDVSTVIRRIGNLDWVEVSSVIRGSSPSTSTVAAKALKAANTYSTRAQAEARANVLGCSGSHSMTVDGEDVYMPCRTHAQYEEAIGSHEYARSSIDNEKGAIPSHLTAWAEDAWDGQLMRGRIKGGAAILRASHAWVDPEGDPELKASYKYLHHHVGRNGKGGAANVRAITTALSNLNARKTSIPETDRRGVYNHLARHLRDAGRKPSELRSAELPDHSKPYPNFHAVRIREPEDFDKFRTTTETLEGGEFDGKQIEILHGREKESGDWEIASFHLPAEEWTVDEAREWGETHGAIKFEPATGEDDSDATNDAASDTAPEVATDTAERSLRLQRAKLALHGIHNEEF